MSEENKKKREAYSYSRLSTFEQCPFKFRLKYIEKIIPEIEETIESVLGKAVHETLEWFYKNIKKEIIPSIEETIEAYAKFWKKNFFPEIKIVKNHISPEDYFNKGIKFLLDYYTSNHPFNDNTIEIETEIKTKIDDAGDYQIIGFIDRLAFNPSTEEYEIHDYKTSGTLPTQFKIDNDRQLALYALAIKEKFGKEKKICLNWHYLNFNKKICLRKTNEEFEKIKKETIALIDKIEDTKEFSAQKTPLCSWCEYKDICYAWGNKLPEKQKELGEF